VPLFRLEAPNPPQARDLARDDLIEVLTFQSGSAVDWIQDSFGLNLNKVSRLGGHSMPRTHRGSEQFPCVRSPSLDAPDA
jgi:hypothetical protein